MTHETRTIAIMVNKIGDPIYSEEATIIRIDDEAGGEFVMVKQTAGGLNEGEIFIAPDEWPMIRDGIDRMISECRKVDA